MSTTTIGEKETMKIFGRFSIPREYVESIVSVILRVPALFILEAWYKSDPDTAVQNTPEDVRFLAQAAYYSILVVVAVLATIPLVKLVTLYMYMISVGLVSGAYHLSNLYTIVEEESGKDVDNSLLAVFKDYEITKRLFLYLLAQCLIGTLAAYLLDMKDWTKYSLLVFTTPIMARLSGLPVRDLSAVHNFATLFILLMVLFYTFNKLTHGIGVLKDGLQQIREAVTEFGYIPVIITYWHAMMMPVQLLIFWTSLFLSQLFVFYQSKGIPADGQLLVLLAGMGECCATPISLFALCIAISYFSYYILTLTKVFLLGWEGLYHDNDLLRGWTEGLTMMLVALQTGLLDLKPLERAFLMSILLFIVVSSLVQSMYEITDPILLVLSASHSRSLSKHLRVLALCTVLWVLPLYMTHQICQYFDLDFWLMIIISSCILTSVQVIGSLLVYWLFLYDTFRTETWERLDDVVYYIRSSVRILEFIVAVFVVCFGIKESLFSEWSWINSGILIIHCYFNVWQRLQTGWKTFLLRREAVHKIESLPEATSDQLEAHNDVCAICFQALNSARITMCGHFFHGCCLRKWLYVKDTCPLCHQQINANMPVDTNSRHLNNLLNVDNVNDLVEGDMEDYVSDSDSSDEEDSEECSDDEEVLIAN
ncbi:RN145-like protein [Mya arenaria]|uniref:RN145-like protein n=1 Tax=Mya arenaria TaxID=6604 RepID=A0ABY7FK68_MYAAR|nr:RING finger protein 145-like [Mya arenaria]WAR21579.1 RN145-like protein [Mya arenaria]